MFLRECFLMVVCDLQATLSCISSTELVTYSLTSHFDQGFDFLGPVTPFCWFSYSCNLILTHVSKYLIVALFWRVVLDL